MLMIVCLPVENTNAVRSPTAILTTIEFGKCQGIERTVGGRGVSACPS